MNNIEKRRKRFIIPTLFRARGGRGKMNRKKLAGAGVPSSLAMRRLKESRGPGTSTLK